MNMKTIVVCASALIFGLCGCDSGSTSGGAAGGLATGPRAVDGALISVGADKASLDKVLGGNKEALYAELDSQLPGDFKEMLTKAGLGDVEVKWGALSVVDVEFGEDGMPKDGVPEIVVALAFDHDADKLFAVIKEELSDEHGPKQTDTAFLGEKALVLSDNNMTVAMASIAGKLLVIGTSEASAEKGVALYRDGKGGTPLAVGGDTILKAVVNAVGERVVKKMPAEMFEGALGPDVDSAAIFQGLKDVDATIAGTAENGLGLTLKIGAASADDAAKIAAFANESLTGIKAMMGMAAAQDPEAKPAVDALNTVSVTTDGATVTGTAAVAGENFTKLVESSL